MRFVIYDDETLEPITVLNLPFAERDIERRVGRRWRVPVLEPIDLRLRPTADIPSYEPARIVEIEFEPFVRRTSDGREQQSWMAFTKAAELALLLNPAWLPGQRPAVQYLQDQNDFLTSLLMRALSE